MVSDFALGLESWAYALAFSPNSQTLARGNEHGFQIWNMKTRQLKRTFLTQHGDGYAPVRSLAHSHDGGMIASGDSHGLVKLWDEVTGAHLRSLRGHLGAVVTLVFSRDGNFVASGGVDCTVRLWNVPSELSSLTRCRRSMPVVGRDCNLTKFG